MIARATFAVVVGFLLFMAGGIVPAGVSNGSLRNASIGQFSFAATTPRIASSSCGILPTNASVSSLVGSMKYAGSSLAQAADVQEILRGYSGICEDIGAESVASSIGISNFTLQLFATNSSGLIFANISADWVSWQHGVKSISVQTWSYGLGNTTFSRPLLATWNSSTSYSDGNGNTTLNWVGYDFTGGAKSTDVTDAWATTSAVSMKSEVAKEDDGPTGLSVDSVAATWVGLASNYTKNGNQYGILQSGYTIDATDPTATWCVGFTDSCDYGLWWEIAGNLTNNGTPVPYSGDPVVSSGDTVKVSIFNYAPGDFETQIWDENKSKTWLAAMDIPGWTASYGDFIVETPPDDYGPISQLPGFNHVTFSSGQICTSYNSAGNCATGSNITLSEAFNRSWYDFFNLEQNKQNVMDGQSTLSPGPLYYPSPEWQSSLYDLCYMNPVYWATQCAGFNGCVDATTPVLTSAGYRPIVSIRPGGQVEEVNLTSGTLTTGTLLSANATRVQSLLDIDGGLLKVTPTDQPMFIRNQTFVGWILNPQNLTTNDSLFDPVTSTWIPITSIVTIRGVFTVMDVITSGWNNFIAAGALLDHKTG